jgi:hypothetical protein
MYVCSESKEINARKKKEVEVEIPGIIMNIVAKVL